MFECVHSHCNGSLGNGGVQMIIYTLQLCDHSFCPSGSHNLQDISIWIFILNWSTHGMSFPSGREAHAIDVHAYMACMLPGVQLQQYCALGEARVHMST